MKKPVTPQNRPGPKTDNLVDIHTYIATDTHKYKQFISYRVAAFL